MAALSPLAMMILGDDVGGELRVRGVLVDAANLLNESLPLASSHRQLGES